MKIIKATEKDSAAVTQLELLLWPKHEIEDLMEEYMEAIESSEQAIFICYEKDKVVAFAHFSLRKDYVEGTSSSPVAYLEGIYVQTEYRGKGIGKKLVEFGTGWGKEKGCVELASDCELTNGGSWQFHINAGFKEANRIICFTKKI